MGEKGCPGKVVVKRVQPFDCELDKSQRQESGKTGLGVIARRQSLSIEDAQQKTSEWRGGTA